MKRIAGATIVAVLAVFVFWQTAFPSISWWNSAEYSLAAATLGVISAPGSLLLTLLGWPVAQLPIGDSPAYRLNLFAGVLAALTAVGVYASAVRALGSGDRSAHRTELGTSNSLKAGAGAGALTFAFGSTTWEHAVMFTPYILTVVVTIAMIYTLVRWWEDADQRDSWKWFALLGLLFGLDFSVHRTNALLFPGALIFILIRRPRTIIESKAILASVGALCVGLSVHLLIIPIARFTNAELNFGNPRDWTRFVEYVSLPNSGGNFFVKVFPRNADVWGVQVADFLRVLRNNALHWSGPASVAGILPALAALGGVVALWRRSQRLAMALLALFVLQSVMTVLFFNIPDGFFRSLDRHYLPVWTTIGVFIACGLGAFGQWALQLRSRNRVFTPALLALVLLVPAAQLIGNWRSQDASNRYFARDYAANMLNALPQNAIHFTVGDNDTFPLMYLQQAEHVRPDVRIVNLSVIQFEDYPDQQRERDLQFPISILSAERKVAASKPWANTALPMHFPKDNAHFGLPADAATLDTTTFTVRPMNGEKMTGGEITFLDIVRTNQWRRPITFAITASRSGMSWLEQYGRLEGIYWRIVPVKNPKPNVEAMRKNLLSAYAYRGYADTAVIVDDVSAIMGATYFLALKELVEGELERGDTLLCKQAVAKMASAIPLKRLPLPNMMSAEVPYCGP